MGEDSWPALSESTRPGVKLLSTIDGSAAAASEAHAVVQLPPKQMKPNSNSPSNPTHFRPRPMR
ncbi:hypothetical protein R6Q59_012354 [Mikania micrantha]